jgi:hypothetical protein
MDLTPFMDNSPYVVMEEWSVTLWFFSVFDKNTKFLSSLVRPAARLLASSTFFAPWACGTWPW